MTLIKTPEDAEEAIQTIVSLIVHELKAKPHAVRFLGRPEMMTLDSNPGELRLEPWKAAVFIVTRPHFLYAIKHCLTGAGMHKRYKDGFGPLLVALAESADFVGTLASAYGAKPLSRKEAGDELYEYLCEHGEAFLAALAEDMGREDLLVDTEGLLAFVLDNWLRSTKAAKTLPDLGLMPDEISRQIEDWMTDAGYTAVAK